jgi:hypothetical protein
MPSRLALLIVVLFLAAPAAATAAEPFGRVVSLDGAALVLRDARRQPLTPGAELRLGDEIRTGDMARVVIESTDGTRIVVGPASEVALRQRLVAREGGRLQVALDLFTGILRLLGGEGAAAPSVETRAAVASVRSTEWLVQATGVGTAVLSLEGEVEVRAASDAVVLRPGEGTDVAIGGAPSRPTTWGQARHDRLLGQVPF